jgi:hypothetical protein
VAAILVAQNPDGGYALFDALEEKRFVTTWEREIGPEKVRQAMHLGNRNGVAPRTMPQCAMVE